MKDIISYECYKIREKEINLDIFTGGIHCKAKTILLYWRKPHPEYILLLKTDMGNLVETNLDFFHANEEFSFICSEDEAAKEDLSTKINLFNFTLYNHTIEQEINHKGSLFICEYPSKGKVS